MNKNTVYGVWDDIKIGNVTTKDTIDLRTDKE
jgi:hypothetical protein